MQVYQVLFSIFVFLVGAVALVIPRGYSIGFYLICLIGLLHWVFTRTELMSDKSKWLLGPPLVYAMVQASIALMQESVWRSLDPYIPFVFITFGFWAIRRYKPHLAFFWIGLALGAIGAACFAGYQALVLMIRAGGEIHPIQFGNGALLMGVLCLVRLLLVRGDKRLDALMLLGFCSGLAASVWSQTRGGWVALAVIFIWLAFASTKSWPHVKRLGLVMVLLGMLAIPVLQPNGIVQTRVMSAVKETTAYWTSNSQASSVGARFAMWSYASKEILDTPFVGHGESGWLRSRDAAIQKGVLDPFLKDFNHLHNEYLDVAYKKGLIGLAVLLILYWAPMLNFFKPYSHASDSNVRALALGGMVLPMMYMDFGLTQAFLSHNSGRMMFASLLMCLGALLLNQSEGN